MLKTLLAATTALTLMSGVSFAETTYSDSTTKSTSGISTPLGGVDVTKKTETRSSDDSMGSSSSSTRVEHHDGMLAEKDKTVTKDTTVSPNGDVEKHKSETTTIR